MNYIFVLDLILEFKNITVKQVSEDSGITEDELQRIIKNKNNVTLDLLYKVSNVINVNAKELFYTKDEFSDLQQKINILIAERGTEDKEVLLVSRILDRLLILKMKEQ